jgi:hypothetical protein
MNNDDIKKMIAWIDEEILLADGFDDAIIGYAHLQSKAVAVYDSSRCIKILMDRDGMDLQDAIEFFEYNVIGAYVGEHTPIFVNILRAEESDEQVVESS